MSLSVKPRAGGNSAQLVKSILNKRVNRKLPVSIGSVQRGADLASGHGLRFRSGYSLASLDSEDIARIQAWLNLPREASKAKVSMSELSVKLDRVLNALDAITQPAPHTPEAIAPTCTQSAASSFDALERALSDALAALQIHVETQLRAGVRLTRKSHLGTEPLRPGNGLDELQAWTNKCRFQLFEEFKSTCQRLGLWKSQAGAEAGSGADSD